MFSASPRSGIEIRLFEERHADTVFERVDQEREHLRPWFPWVDATQQVDDTLQFIKGARERFASKGEIASGIWCEGIFCGSIGTQKLDRLNRSIEIGYWLAKDYEGRGIMTDSCRLLVDYLLTEMDLNRVEIRCAVHNVRSNAVPKRLGFTLDATLREALWLGGHFHDLHIWSLLQREWTK